MTFTPDRPISLHTPTGPSPFATPAEALDAIAPHMRALYALLGPTQSHKKEAIFLTTSSPQDGVSGIYYRPDTAHAAVAATRESQALCHAIATLQAAFQDSPFGRNTPGLELRATLLASGKGTLELKAPTATYVNPPPGALAVSIGRLRTALDACSRVQICPGTPRRWMVCADPANAFTAANLEDAVLLAQAFFQPEYYTALCEGRPAGQNLAIAEIFTDLSAVRARIPHHLGQHAPVPQDG